MAARPLHDHKALRRFERAGHSGEIEQHRRGQTRASASASRNSTNTSAVSVLANAPASSCRAKFRGLIRPPQSWSKISITRIPMGHEVGVTPLQMTVGDGDDRQWRQTRHAAHREIDHRRQTARRSARFRRLFCARSFRRRRRAQIGNALARRGERSRHGRGGGGARFYHCGQNRHGAKSRSQRRIRTRKICRFVLRLSCRPIIRNSSGWSCWMMRTRATPELNYGGLVAGPDLCADRRKSGALSRS